RRFGRFGLFRLGLRFGLRLLLVGAREVALGFLVGLEVRLVPTAALEAEDRRRQQLLQRALAAGRALRERRIRDLLHHLHVELAALALVFVDRHGFVVGLRVLTIITEPRSTPPSGLREHQLRVAG